MIKIAFLVKDKKDWFMSVLSFYAVSFLFAGFALAYNLILENTEIKNGVWQINFSFFTITSAGFFGIILWKTVLDYLKKKNEKNIYEIMIVFKEKEIKVKAFLDTGNRLRDSITGQEVIILDKKSFEELIGINEQELWQKDFININNIRMIPFNSLGNTNGILFTVRVDKVCFLEEELVKENVLIGKYDGILSRKKEYQALIGPDIFERRKRNDGFIRNFKKSS